MGCFAIVVALNGQRFMRSPGSGNRTEICQNYWKKDTNQRQLRVADVAMVLY